MTAGELAHPDWAYHDANGRPLMGPCDIPGCVYASKPGGERHDGECSTRTGVRAVTTEARSTR